jgi:hypothetical protein
VDLTWQFGRSLTIFPINRLLHYLQVGAVGWDMDVGSTKMSMNILGNHDEESSLDVAHVEFFSNFC